MFKYISHNENETKKIACKLASKLKCGDIVILSGNLGAGKTKFAEGFLSFWGLENEISSPTFTIANEYYKNNINIFHIDLYRLKNLSEFYSIGGLEYFTNGICIIEWGELLKTILPPNYIQITFSMNAENENMRYLDFKAYGKRLNNLIEELKQ